MITKCSHPVVHSAKLFCALLVLNGCAGGPRTEVVWISPGVSDQGSQFQIDKGECLALAAQAVPPVRGAPVVVPQQSQQVQGSTSTFQGWSSSGNYVQGQIETRPSNQGWQPQGFLGGYEYARQQQAQEAALAAQLAPYAMQARAQQEYAMSCMLKRGWRPMERTIRR